MRFWKDTIQCHDHHMCTSTGFDTEFSDQEFEFETCMITVRCRKYAFSNIPPKDALQKGDLECKLSAVAVVKSAGDQMNKTIIYGAEKQFWF